MDADSNSKCASASPSPSPSLSQLEAEQTERYRSAGQGHVLKYLPALGSESDDDGSRRSLLEQLRSIDVEDLPRLLAGAREEQRRHSFFAGADAQTPPISPFRGEVGSAADGGDDSLVESSRKLGLDAVARGRVAALVLAGGQGTRLGFDGPKGEYDIGLPSGKSLFRLVAERIVRLTRLADAEGDGDGDGDGVASASAVVPFYVMTSPMNDGRTRSYFRDHDYFGLDPDHVRFFPQGVLPCLDPDGKILMETRSKCAMSPNGNGGVYQAMQDGGVLDDMEGRDVRYVHIFSIDNALVRPADPVFVGYCISRNADCGNKVLWKKEPGEKVGIVAEMNGRASIIEYSDLDPALAAEVDGGSGRLLYGAGNICNHFYTLDFIRNVVLPQMRDMYHVADKKIPVWDDEAGETRTPPNTNGVKLESFIFDVFPLAERMAVWDVRREEEFAPVKNASGSASDSPDTARAMISDLAKSWVRAAGVRLTGADVEASLCEVSPLTSYAGEGMDEVVAEVGGELACPFEL